MVSIRKAWESLDVVRLALFDRRRQVRKLDFVGGEPMVVWRFSDIMKLWRSNKALHATADVPRSSSAAWSHNATVASAWALPSAVRELGR